MPRSSAPAPADLHQDRDPKSPPRLRAAIPCLWQELLKHWMKDHSLRGLHGAQHFAESTASLFSALYQRFDFQVDNVRPPPTGALGRRSPVSPLPGTSSTTSSRSKPRAETRKRGYIKTNIHIWSGAPRPPPPPPPKGKWSGYRVGPPLPCGVGCGALFPLWGGCVVLGFRV